MACLTVERVFEPNNDAVSQALIVKARSSREGEGEKHSRSSKVTMERDAGRISTWRGKKKASKPTEVKGKVLDQKKVTSKPLLQLLQDSERMEGDVCERVRNKS